MQVRKSLFAVLAVAVLVGGSYDAARATHGAVSGPRLVADGGGGTAVVAEEAAPSVLLGDGGDPMPRPPHQLA